MIRKILLCICMGGMLAACSEDILPEVPMFSGSEDHVPMADFIFDGTEGYRELQVDVRDVVRAYYRLLMGSPTCIWNRMTRRHAVAGNLNCGWPTGGRNVIPWRRKAVTKLRVMPLTKD